MNLISKTKFTLEQLKLSPEEVHLHGLDYLLALRSSEELAHQYLHYRQLLHIIKEKFQDKEIQIIKGLNLIDSLYQSQPVRPFSDLDLFIPDTIVLDDLEEFIRSLGFQQNQQDEMSPHKSVWIKQTESQEMVIELHSKLFSFPIDRTLLDHKNEAMFLYLVYHLVYQHTFLRLIWLCDIFLFLQTHTLKTEVIKMYAKKMKLETSIEMTFAALFKVFHFQNADFPISSRMQRLITLNFLKRPKKYFFHYHLIKTLSKNDLVASAHYYLAWLRQRIKGF